MSRKIEIEVFQFDELDDRSKERAREWFLRDYPDYEWWDAVYDDAERCGIAITSFDLDRNLHAEGRFTKNAVDVAKCIARKHGPSDSLHTDTKGTADDFLEEVRGLETQGLDDEELNEKRGDLEVKFRRDILECYAWILQHELEYLTSAEQVDENIRSNEYEFTADGKFTT
jgi:hypothetical protein